MNKTASISIAAVAIVSIILLWYNFGPLPSGWSPKERQEQARVEKIVGEIKAINKETVVTPEYAAAMKEHGRPFKERTEAIIAKWDAVKGSRPSLTQEELDQAKRELDAIQVEANLAYLTFDAKWKQEHSAKP